MKKMQICTNFFNKGDFNAGSILTHHSMGFESHWMKFSFMAFISYLGNSIKNYVKNIK